MLKQSILVIAFVLLTALSSLAQIPNAAEFNRTFTHHTANVNNVRLHYVMGGRDEPVVLLPPSSVRKSSCIQFGLEKEIELMKVT